MKLYRYIPLSRLLTFISSNSNTLRHPTCWEDPFESVMFRARTVREQGLFFNEVENRWQSWPPHGPGPFKTMALITEAHQCGRHFYCQCWTRKLESDAMWRVYSRAENLAARITVECDALLEQTKRSLGERDSAFLEDVNYAAEEEVVGKCHAFGERFAVHLLKRPAGERMWFEYMRELMRWKRGAYDYELETRLMVVAWEQLVSKQWNPEDVPKELAYAFPVNDLIEEVLLHPSYSSEQRESAIRQIRDAGYQGSIRQSELYAPRNFDQSR